MSGSGRAVAAWIRSFLAGPRARRACTSGRGESSTIWVVADGARGAGIVAIEYGAAEAAVAGLCSIERSVLARAVQWHCQDRVLRHNNTTVVF